MRSSLRQGPFSRTITRCLLIAGLLALAINFPSSFLGSSLDPAFGASQVSRDVYYGNEAPVSGPSAPQLTSADYPTQYGESRLIVWMVAQQHLYWGGLACGALMLVTLLEIGPLLSRREAPAIQYDRWAYDILRLVMGGFSVTALLGAGLAACLLVLYPDLTLYLVGIFRPTVLLYVVLALVLTLLAYGYYYTWERCGRGAIKYLHASLGVLANVVAITMVFMANGWSSFMLSPAGVDEQGRFLGTIWHALHTATWNAFNIHRLLSHLVLASVVFACYAAYQALKAKTHEDWVEGERRTYLCLLTMTGAFVCIPFEGVWLLRETYAYRQQMGITQLGGLMAWLGILRVSLVAGVFLGLNYYVWQRISMEDRGKDYESLRKYAFLVLTLGVAVYITPHTMVMTKKELYDVGGQQHQVLGNYGVESAKQAVVNMMILVTIGSWYIWTRARTALTSQQARLAGPVTAGIFLAAGINILWLSIYGYYVPANVRVGNSVGSAATPLMVLVYVLVLTQGWKTQAIGGHPDQRRLPLLIHWVVFVVAFVVTWLVGLGGYVRSSVRLFWHVNELARDQSPWAYTHSVGFAANVISLNAILFWLGLLLLFWLAHVREAEVAPVEILSRDTVKMKSLEVRS